VSVLSVLSSCKKDQTAGPENSAVATSAKVTTTTTTANAAAQIYLPSRVISLSGVSGRTISGKSIAGGTEAAISLSNCHDITITNCKLYNSTNVGIYLYNCYNIIITQNYFTNVSTGVYADHSSQGGINVYQNQFLNMQGPFPRGQFVQFNNVNGGYNQINGNICENILGQSNPEDAISLFQCYGVAGNPIRVNGNVIRGGGPSTSGGGIMLGDSGGAYIVADGNMLVNPGQYGMAISGGSNNSITNNIVYGASQSFTNIGMYVAAFGSFPIVNSTVSGNRVKFYNAAGVLNGAWVGPGVTTPAGWSTNDWDANIDATILPATLITYQ
jgi:parallel beta-helix repeat protein